MAYCRGFVSTFERKNPIISQQLFKRLPRKMLCSDDLERGVFAEDKFLALKKLYIQYNHENAIKIMAFDLDYQVDYLMFKYCDVPVPNLVVRNPKNGHAHFLYFLEDFVCRGEKARMDKLNKYHAVYLALAKRLNADRRFVQLIVKNPYNEHWETDATREEPYALNDFLKYVDIDFKRRDRKRPARMREESLLRASEGRNCKLFEHARLFAYSIVNSMPEDEFRRTVHDFAAAFNARNPSSQGCLSEREVRSVVKSVTNWTLLHMAGMSAAYAKKDVWGDESRRKSMRTRSARKNEKMSEAWNLRRQGKTISEIMDAIGRSKRAVMGYLAEYRRLLEDKLRKFKNDLEKFKRLTSQEIVPSLYLL